MHFTVTISVTLKACEQLVSAVRFVLPSCWTSFFIQWVIVYFQKSCWEGQIAAFQRFWGKTSNIRFSDIKSFNSSSDISDLQFVINTCQNSYCFLRHFSQPIKSDLNILFTVSVGLIRASSSEHHKMATVTHNLHEGQCSSGFLCVCILAVILRYIWSLKFMRVSVERMEVHAPGKMSVLYIFSWQFTN